MPNENKSGNKNKAKSPARFSSAGASRGHRKNTAAKQSQKPAHVTENRKHGFSGGDRPYDYAFYESEPATPEYMQRLFRKHSFEPTAPQLKKFWKYYELLREHNAGLDLTRIMGIEATVLKHFVDSAIVLKYFEPTGPVLDIGSGPGFPGVPLAIMRPETKFILGESRGKRVGFLEKVIKALDLKNTTIFAKSVREDSPLGEDHGAPVGDVITRALETIPPTLERVLPFVTAGRSVAFMKGPGCDEEIVDARNSFEPAFKLTGDYQYTLPATDQSRRLVVFTRQ